MMGPGKNNVVQKLSIINLYLSCDQKDFEEENHFGLRDQFPELLVREKPGGIFFEKISYNRAEE